MLVQNCIHNQLDMNAYFMCLGGGGRADGCFDEQKTERQTCERGSIHADEPRGCLVLQQYYLNILMPLFNLRLLSTYEYYKWKWEELSKREKQLIICISIVSYCHVLRSSAANFRSRIVLMELWGY